MGQYLINYDLHKLRDYSKVYRLMASWHAVRLTESSWLATLVGPAPVIRDIVLAQLDGDDTVAVLQLQHGSDWATVRVSAAATTWLSANILPAQKAA